MQWKYLTSCASWRRPTCLSRSRYGYVTVHDPRHPSGPVQIFWRGDKMATLERANDFPRSIFPMPHRAPRCVRKDSLFCGYADVIVLGRLSFHTIDRTCPAAKNLICGRCIIRLVIHPSCVELRYRPVAEPASQNLKCRQFSATVGSHRRKYRQRRQLQ